MIIQARMPVNKKARMQFNKKEKAFENFFLHLYWQP